MSYLLDVIELGERVAIRLAFPPRDQRAFRGLWYWADQRTI